MKGLTVGLEGAVGTSRSPPEKNEGKKRVAIYMIHITMNHPI